jgi:hypothetical protein
MISKYVQSLPWKSFWGCFLMARRYFSTYKHISFQHRKTSSLHPYRSLTGNIGGGGRLWYFWFLRFTSFMPEWNHKHDAVWDSPFSISIAMRASLCLLKKLVLKAYYKHQGRRWYTEFWSRKVDVTVGNFGPNSARTESTKRVNKSQLWTKVWPYKNYQQETCAAHGYRAIAM